MKDRIYTMIEMQWANEINQPLKIDFFDRTDNNGDYEILRIVGDTLAVSLYVSEKIETIFHRKQLNKRLKAFIEEQDSEHISPKANYKAI